MDFFTNGAIPSTTETESETEPEAAIPHTTKTEPEAKSETDTELEPETKTESSIYINIRYLRISTRIRSFGRIIFSICLSIYLLDIWRFLYLPTQKRLTVDLLLSKSMFLRSKPCWPPTLHNPNYANVWS